MYKIIKKLALGLDRLLEVFALTTLSVMVIIVTVQVFTRTIGNFVYFWSEEVTLLLLVWTAFLGIAIGFREKLHLSMDSVTRRIPQSMQKIVSKVITITVFIFGLYLVIYGWQYTELMHANTLAATGLPRSIQYVIVPITGVLVCIYSFLQIVGIDTRRHPESDDEEEVS
ncbi:C4-dicarboxylate ABC transporter permease [Salipaludibacillus neizhouensis]|uniref:C4-dicarboxylate ABC transporter permease n=1 Tax=Salipaludibacillus neizhouensis TaxID=885475 RepID=A0A3A9K713_9BACI|nr:TRAP transporter small permease [Salipaludibacillus neizhouensis]RKL68347.1 C4-dicarboxylate ABC transporter permease [Salipaludibacillus neizhouensis]